MPPSANSAFTRHVYAVQRYVSLTAPRYAALCKPGVHTHPICCFGNPAEARLVTVGLNPSDGEFAPVRRWLVEITHTSLADRCCNYFTAPHAWFEPWSDGLHYLRASYRDGSAVHLDLSPRATRPVSDLKDVWQQKLFLEMVERDLWIFFGTLELCREVKFVLMAGTVTGKYYINEFLQRFAPEYGYNLNGSFKRLEHPGRAKTARHSLSGNGRKLRVFFCSSSPSDKDKTLLPKHIEEHAEELKL